jgi:hypothetical protein
MNKDWYRKLLLTAASLVLACGTAAAQYDSDGFELPTYTGSPAGVILTGQDGFYIPPDTDSTDYYCYMYPGNVLGVVAHPVDGGEQFVAGVGPGSPTYARAQRDMDWGTGIWTATYDVAALYLGTGTPGDNVGSFSVQPYPGSADYIHLFSWMDAPNQIWRAWYMVYTSFGMVYDQPGISPGPEWDNLVLNHWYRFVTVIDFDLNKVLEVSITDLHTGESATYVTPTDDWYLEGGEAGGLPLPTGFRFFAGGGTPDNCVAWDNCTILPEVECPGDIDGDGDTDHSDLGALLSAWCSVAGDPNWNPNADLDGDGHVGHGDLGIVLSDWGCGLP